MNPQATAGRIVHYTVGKGIKRSAIVMADTPPDGTAAITVFADTGPAPLFGVPYSEIEGIVGHWNWMPYQKEKAKTERGNESESAVDPEEGDGGSVPSDPVGEPAGEPDEAVASGPTEEAAVVDGEAPEVSDAGEAVEPANPPEE